MAGDTARSTRAGPCRKQGVFSNSRRPRGASLGPKKGAPPLQGHPVPTYGWSLPIHLPSIVSGVLGYPTAKTLITRTLLCQLLQDIILYRDCAVFSNRAPVALFFMWSEQSRSPHGGAPDISKGSIKSFSVQEKKLGSERLSYFSKAAQQVRD